MTTNLEVIHRQPDHQTFPLPLLFVHGAYTAAWVWDEYFLSFFARQGYDVHALSLRGHGSSAEAGTLRWTSLTDYAADLNQVIRRLGGTAVLIGHSMGATVVLKCLQTQRMPAVVLMAPVPVDGLLEASLLLAWRDPTLFWDMSLVQSLSVPMPVCGVPCSPTARPIP
ncbi:MAG: lysophospholipase [Rhodospirillaceae bacterium]|nr:MAG: lysophospholipase [Rhodospirillaceae bacterium]